MSPTGDVRPLSIATTDADRLAAVTAPVRDPLWFLARQLQTGALIADDGGSAVRVTATLANSPLAINGQPVTAPLQPDVEAEPATPRDQLDTATRIRLASELIRRIADAGVPAATITTFRAGLAAAYPLRHVLAANPSAPVATALPDPVALYAAWARAIGPSGTTGTLPPIPGAGTSRSRIEPAARTWVGWMTPRLGPVAGPTAPAAWDTTTVGYGFNLTTDLGADAMTLPAADYDGAGLDWYAFDRSPLPTPPQPGPAISVRPSPVTYPGMPERGYWTIEDGTVNLDVLAGQDVSRQLLVAFAHGYSNDWFVIPVQVTPGASLVTSLTVTDSFGSVTTVTPAAAVDGPTARFRLWELTPDAATTDAGVGTRVLLPATPSPLQSPPIEDVLLARDEMANLGWLVERTTTDEDGDPVDRYRRWLSLRTEQDPTFRPATPDADLYYRLGTSVPDYWYPLLSSGEVFSLAEIPPGATDVTSDGVTGILLPHAPGTAVRDEEVSRTGTRISRVHRLLQTPTGRRVWRARHVGAGTGEGSSGLQFDTIGAPALAPNLVANPTIALASRTAPTGTVTRSGRTASLGRDWQTVNVKGGHVDARLEPATRTGEGWQLHVTATKPRSGVAQTFATRATGPHAARAEAWVYVKQGQVALAVGPGGAMKPGAVTTGTGRWERLSAPSGKGPVTQLTLLSQGGPADFIVDCAAARAA